MPLWAVLLLAGTLLSGCGDHDHDHDHHDDHDHDHEVHRAADDHGHDHEDDDHGHGESEPVVVITHYTKSTELFMEHPPLVRGEPVRMIVHLTRLSDFKPVRVGSLEVRLIGEGGASTLERVAAPKRDGLYQVELQPSFAGLATMELVLSGGPVEDVHRIEAVQVHASRDAAGKSHTQDSEEASGERVVFTKEQQWRMDFATMAATTGQIPVSLEGVGIFKLPATGRVIVAAPADGIVQAVRGGSLPEIGERIESGDPVYAIEPDTAWVAGLNGLREAYQLQRLHLERMETLYKSDATAKVRVEEAVIRTRTLAEALRRIGLDPGALETGDMHVEARAPLTGIVSQRMAVVGQRVASGDPLALIEDSTHLLLEALVPSARLGGFDHAVDAVVGIGMEGAAIRISELEGSVLTARAISADEAGFARFLFRFRNPGGALVPGSRFPVRLIGSDAVTSIVIPVSAVLEEEGRAFAYVHSEGEEMQKRFLQLGPEDGRLVAVYSGIEVGERVVTRGAEAIRLSSLSTEEMGHGHVH